MRFDFIELDAGLNFFAKEIDQTNNDNNNTKKQNWCPVRTLTAKIEW